MNILEQKRDIERAMIYVEPHPLIWMGVGVLLAIALIAIIA